MAEARSAVIGARSRLSEVMIQGRPGLALKKRLPPVSMPGKAEVRLLPTLDSYLLGYRRRDLAVHLSLQRRLQRGGGWLHPAVVVDGRAVAAWSLDRAGRNARITIEPFEALSRAIRTGIDTEGRDISRFLGFAITIRIGKPAPSPVPRSPTVSS